MSEDGVTLSVTDLVEYCGTQARLLAGRSETIASETDELLDEIDGDIAEIRQRLTTQSKSSGASAVSPQTPNADSVEEVTQLEKLETELEEKQAVAEAKRTRMAAYRDLSEAYAELAAELNESVDDGQEALVRVVNFERDRNAPAYFEDQETLLETVVRSNK